MTARQLCVRVVHPDLDPDLAMWGDGQGGWQPDALEWVCTLAAAGVPFRAGPNAAADDGAGLLLLPDPNAVDMQVQTSRPVLTGPPPTTVEERLSALARALGSGASSGTVIRAMRRPCAGSAHSSRTPSGISLTRDTLMS